MSELKIEIIKKVIKGKIVEIKVSYEFPPIIDTLRMAFEISPKCYFTYGQVLHNPFRLPLPDDIIAHEMLHMEQQNSIPQLWWGKYLRDKEFRADQEARAYGRQYTVFCSKNKDRNARNIMLMSLARTLSGPLYAHCVGYEWAYNNIKKFSGIK
jgi:hypothetical protein